MKKYNIAVIGATGNVGRQVLAILSERAFPIRKIYAVASASSHGQKVSFGDADLTITTIDKLDFSNIDIAFFSAGSAISERYAQVATAKGCVVIDKSSLFRLDDEVPLIVPEANLISLKEYSRKKIIANPNCCTIPLALVLKPLDNEVKIARLVISTYQSVSGAGTKAMDELYEQTKAKYMFSDVTPKIFPKEIAFNLFPCIGDFNTDGSTSEESKIALELKKIVGEHIKASVTCVRVPVFISHSVSVNIEFKDKISADEISEILSESEGVAVISSLSEMRYASPREIVGDDLVYVSRIRDDNTEHNAVNLWISTDNLRKGAALNGVQIAEELINHYL